MNGRSETRNSPSQPRRVALVVRPAAGGMRRHVETLLAHLDREQFTPILFAPADFIANLRSEPLETVPFVIGPRTSPLQDLLAILRLATLLRQQHIALVHAHGLRGALIGVLAAHRAGIPSLFTAHNLMPGLGRLTHRVFAYTAGRADAIVAVSRAVGDSLIVNGALQKKIVVIPNGIDLSPFDIPLDIAAVRREYGLDLNAPLIAACGRFAPEKGFDLLLDAFARLRSDGASAQLVLIGSGPLDSELRKHAARLFPPSAASLAPPVVFTGHVSDVASLFHAADIIAVPSRSEGQGIVALEAMAAHKPVVASRVGGLVEAVQDGVTGILVPTESPQAFAEALQALLANQVARDALGNAGRRCVETSYQAQEMALKLQTIYRRLTETI